MTHPESSTGGMLEMALLDVRDKQDAAFRAALNEALPLIRRQKGCRRVEVRPCMESPQRYLLLVWWDSLAAHETGFRQSADYRRWRALLHGFYEPFPIVEHYGPPL